MAYYSFLGLDLLRLLVLLVGALVVVESSVVGMFFNDFIGVRLILVLDDVFLGADFLTDVGACTES